MPFSKLSLWPALFMLAVLAVAVWLLVVIGGAPFFSFPVIGLIVVGLIVVTAFVRYPEL